MSIPLSTSAPSIRNEIAREIQNLLRNGRRNYFAQYFLSLVAILASFFAGLSVALAWFGKDVLAIMSALPAAILVASDRLNFTAKSKWNFEKAYALGNILSAIDYEALPVSDASARRRKVNDEHEPRWPGFGAPPAQKSD